MKSEVLCAPQVLMPETAQKVGKRWWILTDHSDRGHRQAESAGEIEHARWDDGADGVDHSSVILKENRKQVIKAHRMVRLQKGQ